MLYSHSSICSTGREYKLSLIAKLPVQSLNQEITLLQFLFILISLFPQREHTSSITFHLLQTLPQSCSSTLAPTLPSFPLCTQSYRTTPPVSILHSLPPHSLLVTHWVLCHRATFWGIREGQNAECPEPTTSCSAPSILGTVPFLVCFLPPSCQYKNWVSAFHLLTGDTQRQLVFSFYMHSKTAAILQYLKVICDFKWILSETTHLKKNTRRSSSLFLLLLLPTLIKCPHLFSGLEINIQSLSRDKKKINLIKQ